MFTSLALSKDNAPSSSGCERFLVHHGEREHQLWRRAESFTAAFQMLSQDRGNRSTDLLRNCIETITLLILSQHKISKHVLTKCLQVVFTSTLFLKHTL